MGNSNANIVIMMKAVEIFNQTKPCVVALKNGANINALLIVENKITSISSPINGYIICVIENKELLKISYDEIKDIFIAQDVT